MRTEFYLYELNLVSVRDYSLQNYFKLLIEIVSNSVVRYYLSACDTIKINAQNISSKKKNMAIQFYSYEIKPVGLENPQSPVTLDRFISHLT
jgi:hypothetical protein